MLAPLHNPLQRETYTATRGGGAFLNQTPITPSRTTDLSVSIVSTSQPPFVGDQPQAIANSGRALAALLPSAPLWRSDCTACGA